MPALTNNTGRKSPKRKKESERSRSPNEFCDDDDDDDNYGFGSSSHSSPYHSEDESIDDVLKGIDLGLVARREELLRHSVPASNRSLNPDTSSFASPFHRNTVAESIKENCRSENDFVYLNNLYTFSAAKRSYMDSLTVDKEYQLPIPPSGCSPQKEPRAIKNTDKLKGLQRHRTSGEEFEYEKLLKKEKGFEIKHMLGDGNCLFRSVADQLFGDQERHAQVRKDCMDYMERNREYFSQYIVEDFDEYLARKRTNGVYGNHVEVQSIAELYNRRVEIYCYELTPLNIFQGEMGLSDATPIRISYHNGCHFNSVVDTRHAFVPIGPEMPRSYERPSEPSVETGIVKTVMMETENEEIESNVLKSVEKESEQKDLEAAMLKTAQADSVAADTESQVIRTIEKESEEMELEDEMVKTVQAESGARNLEDEIMRQVMMESAKEANVSSYGQDDDLMLQLALQQSCMDNITDFVKSIKIPPFQTQPPPPQPPSSASKKR